MVTDGDRWWMLMLMFSNFYVNDVFMFVNDNDNDDNVHGWM